MFEQSQKFIENPEEVEESRCRICYDSTKPLISVCNCGGSIAYVHEECILDWMTTKIQAAEVIDIPTCQICHSKFSAHMKIGEKIISKKILWTKILQTTKAQICFAIIHLLVFLFSVFQIITFTASILNGSFMQQFILNNLITKIFTNFICQIYVILYFKNYLQNKQSLIAQSMIQVVQLTLKPRLILKK